MPRKLPKYVRAERSRHGRLCFYYWLDGRRIRLPDDPKSDAFKTAVKALSEGTRVLPERAKIAVPTFEMSQQAVVGLTLERAVRGARHRASKRAISFDLTPEWALSEAKRQRFRCALTGIPFFVEMNTQTKIQPYAPSLDRINPRLGYTQANTRIVIYAVNVMLMDWGELVFSRVANAYRAARIKRRTAMLAPDQLSGLTKNKVELRQRLMRAIL